jgi:hypothetical protein
MKSRLIPLFSIIIFYSKKPEEYLKIDGVVAKKPKALKKKCCESYKKGKRCKRCPCFDLQ